MSYLPASYDAWRTTAPEPDPFHPGPHRNALLIETGDVTIDAWGWYDGDGVLESVEIDRRHVSPGQVQIALTALGHGDYTSWAGTLDTDTLAQLSADAFDAEAGE
jgi:hypothetical protein